MRIEESTVQGVSEDLSQGGLQIDRLQGPIADAPTDRLHMSDISSSASEKPPTHARAA